MSNENFGILIILTGKTASGKDTIISQILKHFPNMKRVITTTSRKIREGEKDGLDYYFITKNEFRKRIESQAFIEYVEYGGNLYGTTNQELEALKNGDLIWKIDPSRAGEIRDFIKRAYPKDKAFEIIKRILVIYITTSDDVILQRLKSRNLSDEEIQKRMRDDQNIWHKFHDKYDYIVENIPGKLDQTIEKIVKLKIVANSSILAS